MGSMQALSERRDTTEAEAGGHRGATRAQLVSFALIAAVVVAADQATKALVRARLAEGQSWPEGWDLIRLAHVENSGAAFGIFQGGGIFLVGSSVIAIVAIALFLIWAPLTRLHAAALALIFGGAAGNLIDRVARGTVTDFIDPTHYPSFNIADSAIVVGVGALFLLTLLEERRERAARRAGQDKD
jgi:signal peptidase II